MSTVILYGVLGGAVYAASGFLKNTSERFDYKKFVRTVVLGALVGLTNALLGLPVDEAGVVLALSAGEVAVVENLAKAVLRRIAAR